MITVFRMCLDASFMDMVLDTFRRFSIILYKEILFETSCSFLHILPLLKKSILK